MGEVFAGRFELLDPIAEGGMGSVWQVRDHRDGRTYAGKVLRQSDAGSLLRFMREQSTRVVHPHVVTPLSWAGEDDRVLFTMPLVDGGSVATLIGDHGPLPIGWTGVLLDQTLQALEAVHAAGLVHRDVKPANLLLRATGSGSPHLLLTDFGLAAPVDEPRLTRASQVLGTAGYLAPEQLRGADPHPAQDVYAVGVAGLEMLTGRRPSPDGAVAADVPPAGDDRTGLRDLLLAASSPDPARRPRSAAAFRARLRGLHLPPPERGPEAPYVFDQLGSPSAPAAGRPVEDAAADRGARRDRAAALLLLVVAVGALVAAGALLLG